MEPSNEMYASRREFINSTWVASNQATATRFSLSDTAPDAFEVNPEDFPALPARPATPPKKGENVIRDAIAARFEAKRVELKVQRAEGDQAFLFGKMYNQGTPTSMACRGVSGALAGAPSPFSSQGSLEISASQEMTAEDADACEEAILTYETLMAAEEVQSEPAQPRYEATIPTSNRFGALKEERAPKRKMAVQQPSPPKARSPKKWADICPKDLVEAGPSRVPESGLKPGPAPSTRKGKQTPGIPVKRSRPTSQNEGPQGLPTKRHRDDRQTATAKPQPSTAKRPAEDTADHPRPQPRAVKRPNEDTPATSTPTCQQLGAGQLDSAVRAAVREDTTILNTRTRPFDLPRGTHVISDTSYEIPKFELVTRRLEVRSRGDVRRFVRDLLDILLRQGRPDEKVAMSIMADDDPADVCHIMPSPTT